LNLSVLSGIVEPRFIRSRRRRRVRGGAWKREAIKGGREREQDPISRSIRCCNFVINRVRVSVFLAFHVSSLSFANFVFPSTALVAFPEIVNAKDAACDRSSGRAKRSFMTRWIDMATIVLAHFLSHRRTRDYLVGEKESRRRGMIVRWMALMLRTERLEYIRQLIRSERKWITLARIAADCYHQPPSFVLG